MDLKAIIAKIPYLVPHRLEVEVQSDGAVQARLPFRSELTNHVGTLHAAAIYTVAETCAGVAASRIVPGDRSIVLLRGAKIDYTRRAEGDLVATAHVLQGQSESALSDFDARGRADAQVEVHVIDPGQEQIFAGIFDYALRPIKS